MADPTDVISRICDDGEPDKLSRIAAVLGMDKVEAQRDRLHAALSEAQRAMAGVIRWDISRNYIVPYKVRDPVHAAIKAIDAAGVPASSSDQQTEN